MYYADLSTECQVASGPLVRAVGWLSSEHDFTQGEVEPGVVDAIHSLIANGWMHIALAGPHRCELCERAMGSSNLLVPSSDVLYVAPAMITHYMTEHAYAPPVAFRRAVLACPPPPTDAYFDALRPFLDVFSATPQSFERSARGHRERLEARDRAAAEDAKRKPFTWD